MDLEHLLPDCIYFLHGMKPRLGVSKDLPVLLITKPIVAGSVDSLVAEGLVVEALGFWEGVGFLSIGDALRLLFELLDWLLDEAWGLNGSIVSLLNNVYEISGILYLLIKPDAVMSMISLNVDRIVESVD